MPDKMLKFVKIGQQTPPKREVDTKERKILMKFMTNISMKKLKNSRVDVHNVEFLFVKFIVL